MSSHRADDILDHFIRKVEHKELLLVIHAPSASNDTVVVFTQDGLFGAVDPHCFEVIS